MSLQGQVVERNQVLIETVIRAHPIGKGVAAHDIEIAPQVGVTVAQGVEHGGANAEEAVVAHLVIDHRTVNGVYGIPVHPLHVKEGVQLVHPVPKVFENIGGCLLFVFSQKQAFTRSEGDCQKADYNDIELYEKQHLVKITKPFFIGKYEVTQKQYKAIMGDNPSKFKGENKPVECVDALDAGRFCDKLNQKYSSLLPNNYRFDLPTEAQWEYACRAGTTTPYNNPISYKSSSQEFYIELGEIAWFDWNSKGETYDVGLKKPNLWEIYDMHGNVWEWCRDEYKRDYDKYMIDPCVFSGLGDSFGDNVVRGGSFCNHYLFLRSAFRGYEYGGSEKNFIGFRVALVPID